jgi:hypothetical protein
MREKCSVPYANHYSLWNTKVGPICCSTKRLIAITNMGCSQKVTSYFTKETITDEDKHIATEEGLFAFHTIKHDHSSPSMDCTILSDKKSACTKIVMWSNVMWSNCCKCLGSFGHATNLEELETVRYISVVVDTSDHKSVLVRYISCGGYFRS